MKVKELVVESAWDVIKSAAQKVFSFVVLAINRLSFDQRVEINLKDYIVPIRLNEVEDKKATRDRFDLTSIIGYYNEYAVAWKLAYGLEYNGVNINTNIAEGLKAHCENYKNYIVDNIEKFKQSPNEILAELQRAEDGSEIMAKKMFDEITKAHDVKLIDADIHLTGKEAMGIGKEDIKVVIKKKSTDEVLDMIKASLKLYKGSSGVNLYNATFPSYLLSVITGSEEELIGKKAISHFLEQYPQYKDDIAEVMTITDEWKRIKTSLKKEKNPDYRKKANEFVTQNRGYQKMRDLLFKKMFSYFYERDKAQINKRILHRLGLDGADDVYLLVGTERQRMTAVSSRTSNEFKRVYEQLKSEFTVKFIIPDDPEVVACTMIIEGESGEILAKITISFKEGGTFPHMWNMSDIVRSAKKDEMA
jgi:hypothetical protein